MEPDLHNNPAHFQQQAHRILLLLIRYPLPELLPYPHLTEFLLAGLPPQEL